MNAPALVWMLALLAFMTAVTGTFTERFRQTAAILSVTCMVASVAIGIG